MYYNNTRCITMVTFIYKRNPLKKYSCSEEALSLALFERYGIIVQRLLDNGINVDKFGFENFRDFISIIPELKRCTIKRKKTIEIGDILRIVPDSNILKNERHTVYVVKIEKYHYLVADDNGYYYVKKNDLEREWHRTENLVIECGIDK